MSAQLDPDDELTVMAAERFVQDAEGAYKMVRGMNSDDQYKLLMQLCVTLVKQQRQAKEILQ